MEVGAATDAQSGISPLTEGEIDMRLVYCFCGCCIRGTTDIDLFQQNRNHQNHAHPTHQTTDAQIWAVIKANAHKESGRPYHEEANPDHQTSAHERSRRH